MWKDPIVEEIRRARRKLAAEFDHDIDAICTDARKRERKSRRKVVDLSADRKRRTGKQVRSGR